MVKGQKRTRPGWSKYNFKPPKRKQAKPVACNNCGKVQVPHAHHNKLRFCSFQCGKDYLRGKAT